jgi:hypothetical protein
MISDHTVALARAGALGDYCSTPGAIGRGPDGVLYYCARVQYTNAHKWSLTPDVIATTLPPSNIPRGSPCLVPGLTTQDAAGQTMWCNPTMAGSVWQYGSPGWTNAGRAAAVSSATPYPIRSRCTASADNASGTWPLPSWMRCATIAGCLPWASRGSLIVTSRPLVPALVRVRDLAFKAVGDAHYAVGIEYPLDFSEGLE